MITHHFGGGVYSKEVRLPAGYSMGKHTHSHDHLSILGSGTAVLVVDGTPRTITGPVCLTIQAGKVHEVYAVTDIVWFCTHATEETNPDKIDHELVKEH